MTYKNLSNTTKTFYGVTFKPGESHDVPGFITNLDFIIVDTTESELKSTEKKSTTRLAKVGSTDGGDNN
nr:MAG TPA: hypothetical protein [Caudoviricetes sp.]